MSKFQSTALLHFRAKPRANSLIDLGAPKLSPDHQLISSKYSPRPRISSRIDLPIIPAPTRNQNPSCKLKTSVKPQGLIKAFAACTSKGLIRSYNEDRVSIVPRIKINELERRVSYFALFDGHGGAGCADFLAENLHQIFFNYLRSSCDVLSALENSFSFAEKTFFNSFFQKTFENSGSCACSVVINGKNLYVSNLGDSRAILGSRKGTQVYQLSVDHKPGNSSEKERIEQAGGKIIQSNGVLRILPGKLSVSRAFGDFSAKIKNLGGNPNVLISKPDISIFTLKTDFDYILIASDGVFDVLSNEEVNSAVWQGLDSACENLHEKVGLASKNVIELAMEKGSLDNVTCIVVLIKDLADY